MTKLFSLIVVLALVFSTGALAVPDQGTYPPMRRRFGMKRRQAFMSTGLKLPAMA